MDSLAPSAAVRRVPVRNGRTTTAMTIVTDGQKDQRAAPAEHVDEGTGDRHQQKMAE